MSEESDSVYYGSGDMVSPVEQVEGGTRDSASSSSASSSSPAAAAAAAGHATYSSAEVEEIRLHYREEALKAVEVARRKALTDARDHFEETIRWNRDNVSNTIHLLKYICSIFWQASRGGARQSCDSPSGCHCIREINGG